MPIKRVFTDVPGETVVPVSNTLSYDELAEIWKWIDDPANGLTGEYRDRFTYDEDMTRQGSEVGFSDYRSAMLFKLRWG